MLDPPAAYESVDDTSLSLSSASFTIDRRCVSERGGNGRGRRWGAGEDGLGGRSGRGGGVYSYVTTRQVRVIRMCCTCCPSGVCALVLL